MKKKVFSLEWCFEEFDEDVAFFTKKMFGGLAAYLDNRMVMLLAEDPGETTYRGKDYEFEIWNGVLIPTDRIHHKSLLEQYNGLVTHPVLGKWLYLPMETDIDFESLIREIGQAIASGDERFGIISVPKSRKKNVTKKKP